MNTLLNVNITNRVALLGSSPWQPPTMTFGESLTVGMRFTREIGGAQEETSLDVQALSATVGEVDARPIGGHLAFCIGTGPSTESNTTAALPGDVSASDLQTAINALPTVVSTYGSAKVSSFDDSWIIIFGDGTQEVPIRAVKNRLRPVTFARVEAWQLDEQWHHEIRLVVAPVAFTDAHERVLPPPPSVRRIQSGHTEAGGFYVNEIQELYLPPEFRGTYQLKLGYKKTSLLSLADGPEEIQTALSVFGKGFAVTNPRENVANIEFVEDFKGTPQDLLEVRVFNAPEGDLTFTLNLDRAELAARLRATHEVKLPLEVKLMVADSDDAVREIVAFRNDLTIQRGVAFPELALIPHHDWLRPPSPKDYVPRDPSQIITGQQHYPFIIGDGDRTTIVVDHDLGTDDLSGIVLRRVSDGQVLHHGEDYEVSIKDENSVEFVFPTAPDEAGIAGVLTSAGPTSAFIDGLRVHIPQVIGLEDVLDDLGGRLETLEGILPSTGPGATTDTTPKLTIEIPATDSVLFWAGDAAQLDNLPRRAPFMLPAVHTSDASTSLPSPLPAASTITAPAVYTYEGETDLSLSIGGGIRDRKYPAIVQPGGFVACDGRAWYPVTRDGSTKSYYPTIFDRELFAFVISEKMLRVGRTLSLEFGLALRLLEATSAASWVLELRAGIASQDTTPATTGLNLKNVEWNETPILRSRLVMGPLETSHFFGLRIARSVGGLALDLAEYGVWEGKSEAAPDSANFAIQARLIQFDTENSKPKAQGHVLYRLFGGSADAASPGSPATVKIS